MRTAFGGESIRRFDSEITVHQNGTQTVSETIRVLAERKQIKHGIFRDFPLQSADVTFQVESVRIDGRRTSDYEVQRSAGRVRVMMGNKELSLPPGEHTFTLTYETSGHLQFIDKHCEFGWNVTGGEWAFVIEEATCRITVPEDVIGITDTTGWLGEKGATDSPIAFSKPESNVALFVAEKEIRPGEDFTVAVRFPRELVANPQHGRTLRSILILLLTFGYFFVTWRIWGKDPKPGTIIPLFNPPEAGYYGGKTWSGAKKSAMSSAAASYVKNAAFLDTKGFASLFVSLAAQGLCEIRGASGDNFIITPLATTKPRFGPLAEEEVAAYDLLLRASGVGKDFVVSSTNANTIQRIHDRVVDILSKRYATLWAQNLWIQAVGWLLVLPTAVVALNSTAANFVERLIPMGILAAAVFLVHRQVAYFWSRSINSYNPAKIVLTIVAIIAYFALRLRAISLIASGAWLLFFHIRSISIATIALVAIPMFFCPVMKAPSRVGRALLDKIDGLLMYIKTAEQDRLKALNPPDETPETFERILPYAVAFGLEKTWCKRFESKFVFDQPLVEGRDLGQGGYNLGRLFRSGVNSSSFSKSLARSAVPPAMAHGAGSFFGGGGGRFGGGAGFGRGGGGGGGW